MICGPCTDLMKRRDLLQALGYGALITALPAGAHAMRRTNYGGHLTLSLPVDVSRVDPHDSESLASALFGPSLFEGLYGITAAGTVFPTLAEEMPQRAPEGVEIRLRPGLKFSSNKELLAKDVAHSIVRSKKMSGALGALPTPSTLPLDPYRLTFSSNAPDEVARLLALPRAALVPSHFDPHRPIGSGALSMHRVGPSLELTRNPLCPRGGSYVDSVRVQTLSLSACLRAFEARTSDLGFLGRGLHQERKDARAFRLPEIAEVVLIPGQGLHSFARPGVLQNALDYLPFYPFQALGVAVQRREGRRWGGPSLTLSVSKDEPWLYAIGEELVQAWSRPDTPVRLIALAQSELNAQTRRGEFDLRLTALTTAGLSRALTTQELFRLDGRPPPRGGRAMTPQEAGRQLSLGVLGALTPHGALDPRVNDFSSSGYFDLAETWLTLPPTRT